MMMRPIRCFLGLFFLACGGCGPGFGEVSGLVTFQGEPLPGGTVTFRPADPSQNSVACILERDGKFHVTLPVGEVAVCIDNREFEPQEPTIAPSFGAMKLSPEAMKQIKGGEEQDRRQQAQKSDRYRKIPEKYHACESSGLTLTVKKGTQTANIELTE